MSIVKTIEPDQFMHENSSWERLLDFYKQENAYLKTRLSQVLDNNSHKNFVEIAEYFNSRFISMDEAILLLQQDIRKQKDNIANPITDNSKDIVLVQPGQTKLRIAMATFEKEMSAVKNDFNQQLASFLRPS